MSENDLDNICKMLQDLKIEYAKQMQRQTQELRRLNIGLDETNKQIKNLIWTIEKNEK